MNISEIQLLTNDLDQTRYFYGEVLCLQILSTNHDSTSFSAGRSVLTFQRGNTDNPVYHFAFNIPHNKFEEAVIWTSSKIELIEISPFNSVADFRNWNAKAFYFYDNNKNIVEMIARFDLDNSSNGAFDGASISSISEIGVVVVNPKAYANELIENYQLPFFSRQPPADDFIAMGDDEGLFIVVSENRKWYPTDIRSAKHWAKITLALPGRVEDIFLNKKLC